MNTMKIGLALCLSLILIGSSTGLTCIQCSSSNTAECTTTPGQVNSTCESKLCFHTQDKETKEVIRGCFSDQSTSVCKLPECKVCDASDRCNNDPYNIECLLCDSSNNENCKAEIHLIKTSCESTTCFARINRDTGEVLRGCVKDNGCSGDKDCHTCNTQRCNLQKLPITNCYSCIGPTCVDPDINVVPTKSCEGGNKCIVKYNDKQQVYRGCTEVSDQKCPKGEACSICDTDKCNSGKFPFQENAKLSCMKCDSSQAQLCSDNDLVLASPEQCKGTYPFHEKEACFVDTKMNSIERGCFYELTSDEQVTCLNNGNCQVCHSEGCNRYNDIEENLGFKCYICDGCEKLEGRTPTECSPIPSNKNGGPGCFVKRNDDQTVSRNCLSKSDCSGDKCKKCTEDSCNTMDAPGGGSLVIGMNGLIGVLVLLSVKLL